MELFTTVALSVVCFALGWLIGGRVKQDYMNAAVIAGVKYGSDQTIAVLQEYGALSQATMTEASEKIEDETNSYNAGF